MNPLYIKETIQEIRYEILPPNGVRNTVMADPDYFPDRRLIYTFLPPHAALEALEKVYGEGNILMLNWQKRTYLEGNI
jgi:hypothetical protein